MIEVVRDGEIAEIRIQHEKELNPFTRAMTRDLTELSAEIESDDAVTGVLLWGGEGRSFSIGGDFADLRALKEHDQVLEYLREIVFSYQGLLGISKPLVAAMDHHAIGQGLQVALMSDWRVATERSLHHMPELANGVPCPLGSVILESFLGRAGMLHLVIGCGRLDAEEARRFGLVDEICPHEDLKTVALERLKTFCGYPQVAYRVTKKIQNRRFSQLLDDVREPAAEAHARSYLGGQADEHFSRILGDKK